ncbi:hypothetical protein FB565_005170 [Actinoplanes lutulentus]|uniref:Excreted virulence factor EspC (Type VII ESX diderm) n=1 Tax=Actinoplanes lutulentus TaxID=1287878 RepID=A0A327ZH02_9ACTN|nr:hypothetical protein [Actinoplanes lutulentus]MBB2945437.1 hypothetical protein [Actinoplanes lutulentus]RAK40432.1 excreted virulence factor EspC (type VII ESX diderm) [Actinoplanes lutulentus]
MNPDFQVDADELIRQATAADDIAARLNGTADAAPHLHPSPRWAATTATALVADALRLQLRQLGGDVSETARLISAAAAAYQEADARAAARFRLSR